MRPLKRLSVFAPEVIYPARRDRPEVFPDELLDFFDKLLHKDERGKFPTQLLENLRWTQCSACGAHHARGICPVCAERVTEERKKVTIRGRVTLERIFSSSGTLLKASLNRGDLRVLHHQDGQLRRENGRVVLQMQPGRNTKYRIFGESTLVARAGQLAVIDANGAVRKHHIDSFRENTPVLDANDRHYYWLSHGKLYRDDRFAPKYLGDVLRGQTYIWVGPTFGFGFYRAGELQVSFVFDAEKPGINDSLKLPRVPGVIVDATCFFTDSRCWFLVAADNGGKIMHHCFVLRADGALRASAHAEEGDGSWLGTLRGKVAATIPGSSGNIHSLFAATDRGLVRVEENGTSIKHVADFPDTRGMVDSSDTLLVSKQGILVVTAKAVRRLSLSS